MQFLEKFYMVIFLVFLILGIYLSTFLPRKFVSSFEFVLIPKENLISKNFKINLLLAKLLQSKKLINDLSLPENIKISTVLEKNINSVKIKIYNLDEENIISSTQKIYNYINSGLAKDLYLDKNYILVILDEPEVISFLPLKYILAFSIFVLILIYSSFYFIPRALKEKFNFSKRKTKSLKIIKPPRNLPTV